jgi:uncharacterized protein YhfF
MADQLLALVLTGVKTASCGALRDFPADNPGRPSVGRRDIVLDGAGQPAAVIETVEVTERRFEDVDEAFAREEGARTLAEWRMHHQAYFSRNGGYAPDMWLLCERFRLVETLNASQGA